MEFIPKCSMQRMESPYKSTKLPFKNNNISRRPLQKSVLAYEATLSESSMIAVSIKFSSSKLFLSK